MSELRRPTEIGEARTAKLQPIDSLRLQARFFADTRCRIGKSAGAYVFGEPYIGENPFEVESSETTSPGMKRSVLRTSLIDQNYTNLCNSASKVGNGFLRSVEINSGVFYFFEKSDSLAGFVGIDPKEIDSRIGKRGFILNSIDNPEFLARASDKRFYDNVYSPPYLFFKINDELSEINGVKIYELLSISLTNDGSVVLRDFTTRVKNYITVPQLQKILPSHYFNFLLFHVFKTCNTTNALMFYREFTKDPQIINGVTYSPLGIIHPDESGLKSRDDIVLERYRFLRCLPLLQLYLDFFEDRPETYELNTDRTVTDQVDENKAIVRVNLIDGADLTVNRDKNYFNMVTQIATRRHLPQDIVACVSESVLLLDGISISHSTNILLELLVNAWVKSPDILIDGYDLTEVYNQFSTDIGVPSVVDESIFFAVGVQSRVLPHARTNARLLDLFAVGDSYAMHLDAKGKLVQVLGGETAEVLKHLVFPSESITASDFSRVLSNNSYIKTGFTVRHDVQQKNWMPNRNPMRSMLEEELISPARSRSQILRGDILIMVSDVIEKIFDRGNFEGLCISDFSDRHRNTYTNRSQQHCVYAAGLKPFINYIRDVIYRDEPSPEVAYKRFVEFFEGNKLTDKPGVLPCKGDDGSVSIRLFR